MSVEEKLRQFINSQDILPPNTEFEIKPEYFDDMQPQVYILHGKNKQFQRRIRIISDRNYAIKTEEKACSILETCLSDNFYPKVLKKYDNVSGIGDILITEYKRGVSLDKCILNLSPMEYSLIASQLCTNLKKMHSIKSSDFFDFTYVKSKSWTHFFEIKLRNYLNKALADKILNTKELEYITRLFINEKDIFQLDCGSFIHFDVKPANIIWDITSRKTYLIDFEMSRYGDILMEFTKGKFTAQLFGNPIYESNIWKPMVEQYFAQPYTDIFSLRKSVWYLFYHYLAHCTYQLNYFGNISSNIQTEFLYYKECLFS